MGVSPCQPSAQLIAILDPLYSLWKVPLLSTNTIYYASTDDFGCQVDRWLMAPPVDGRRLNPLKSALAGKRVWEGYSLVHTVSNMQVLAAHLGIALQPAASFYCVRDPFICCFDGSFRLPCYTDHIRDVVECVHAANLYLDNTAATRTKNQLFNRWSGYTSEYIQQAGLESEQLFGSSISKFAYSYVEGGNVWMMTNQQSERQVCIGADHLLHTLHLLDNSQYSWESLAGKLSGRPSFVARQQALLTSLSKEQLVEVAEEMYAQGLLLQDASSGQINRQLLIDIMVAKFKTGHPLIRASEKGWLRQIAIELGAIASLEWSEEVLAMRLPLVAAYLAKRAVTQELMARDFGVMPAALHFITQAHCHLDLFMRPGPRHSVFIVNYSLAADICRSLLEAADQLCLNVDDCAHLERYEQTARKLDHELGALLNEAAEQIKRAGFTVVAIPGHFVYEAEGMYGEFPVPTEGYSINFTNALSGWSARTRSYYYIAHGLHNGEQVGALLMQAFTYYLQQYVSSLDVYFIGYDPLHQADFSEALDWWNRLETQCGIHCLTRELTNQRHVDSE